MGYFLLLSKSATSDALNASELLLLASGIALVIGLVGEWKLPWWHPKLRRFEFLVILGCAGELFADAGVFLFSAQLERISNTEIATLQAATADRELTGYQQRKIGLALSKHAGKTVWLRSYSADPEAMRLGREIISALHLAKIDTEDRLGEMGFGTSITFGIRIVCAQNALFNDRPFARELIAVLSAKEGGNLSVLPLSELGCSSDEITELLIGIKPPTLVK